MSDNKPSEEIDVTKEWRATHGQKSAATRLRILAAISWLIAIGGEIFGIVQADPDGAEAVRLCGRGRSSRRSRRR